MNEEQKQQLIKDYLDGNLSAEDQAFIEEARLRNDPIIEELKQAKKVVSSLKVNHQLELKRELTEMLHKSQQDKIPEGKTASFPNQFFYGIAATAIILITATLVIVNVDFGPADNEALFLSFYRPMTIPSNDRGEGEQEKNALNEYNNENYQEAAQLLENQLSQSPGDVFSKILLGNCYLKTERFNDAIPIFEELIKAEDPYYVQYSHWYLSLAYLKTGQVERCKQYLEIIISEQMIHEVEAKNLKEELD